MMTPIPDLKSRFASLIRAPSISAVAPALDMSNHAVIALLNDWLTTLGFDCSISVVAGSRHKQNLLGRIGSGEGGLLLAGHTDTVPCDEGRWRQDPFTLTERDNRWYGLGSCDMKGFFALVLEALMALPLEKLTRPIYVFASADEETTMAGAKEFATEAQIRPSYALIGEPTSLRPVYMHKGHLTPGIRITGRSGHSSDPARGLNAIDIMHRVIGRLQQLRQHLAEQYREPAFSVPYPTLNLGHIHGGDAANRICGCCDLHLDIRPLPGLPLADLELMLIKYLADISREYPGAVEIRSLFPGSEAFAGVRDSAWTHLVESLSGHTAEAVNYATEAPYISRLGCQTLVLGPGSIDQAHQADEYLAMDQLKPTVTLLKSLIHRACFQSR